MPKEKRPITLTQAKIRKMKEDVTWKTLVMFIACAMDEFDWDENDVEAFSIRLNRYMEAVDTHLISVHKVAKIVEEVTGMKITKEFK